MAPGNSRRIITPDNEFLKRKQELFNLYLKMPVEFEQEWKLFKKKCTQQGMDFEDVLGDLIVQFNQGDIVYKGR